MCKQMTYAKLIVKNKTVRSFSVCKEVIIQFALNIALINLYYSI